VSDDRSALRPSATLLLARLRSKCIELFSSFDDGFWRCGGLIWGNRSSAQEISSSLQVDHFACFRIPGLARWG
jgi:hypothetical protein